MSSSVLSTANQRRRLAENLKSVREQVAEAAIRANRRPDEVRLIAVTKGVDLEVVKQLLDLGQLDLGENRVQQLVKRASLIDEQMQRRAAAGNDTFGSVRWHMIGQLQRNKVRQILPLVQLIHSMDTLRLAEEISARAEKDGQVIEVLVQANISGEKSKSGVPPAAVPYLVEQVASLPKLKVVGLMTMAPLVENAEDVRSVFARTRELFEEIRGSRRAGPEFAHLSMGMSNDFEVAIEEGATLVRVGTALFEGVTPVRPDQAISDAEDVD
jgi:pyridoxal phosphate enzyme (YggS family)